MPPLIIPRPARIISEDEFYGFGPPWPWRLYQWLRGWFVAPIAAAPIASDREACPSRYPTNP